VRAALVLGVAVSACRGTPPARPGLDVTVASRDAAAVLPCDAELALAATLSAEGRLERTLRALDAFAARCPESVARSWRARVTALAAIGRRAEALALAATIEAEPDADELTRGAARAARLAAAAPDEGPIADGDWGRATALEDEGYALLEYGSPERALDRFRRACQLHVSCTQSRTGAALAMRALGDRPGAQRELDRALYLAEAAASATGATAAKVVAAAGLPDRGTFVASPTSARWALVTRSVVSLLHGSTLRQLLRVDVPKHVGPAPTRFEDRVCVDRCTAGAFSPNGTSFAWTSDGQSLFALDLVHPSAAVLLADDVGFSPMSVAFSPDGRLMATNLRDGIGLWDMATHTRLAVVAGATPIAFSADGSRITTSKGVFDVASGRLLRALRLQAHEDARYIAADARSVVTATGHTNVRIHDLEGRAPPAALPGAASLFRGALSPDGRLLATTPVTATMTLWDVATRREAQSWTPDLAFEGIAFSPSGAVVAAWGSPARVELWDVIAQRPLRTLKAGASGARGTYVNDAIFSSDGSLLLAYTNAPYRGLVWARARGGVAARADDERAPDVTALPERSRACRIGRDLYPFALCEDRERPAKP
jgi:WD40 repeat protein